MLGPDGQRHESSRRYGDHQGRQKHNDVHLHTHLKKGLGGRGVHSVLRFSVRGALIDLPTSRHESGCSCGDHQGRKKHNEVHLHTHLKRDWVAKGFTQFGGSPQEGLSSIYPPVAMRAVVDMVIPKVVRSAMTFTFSPI